MLRTGEMAADVGSVIYGEEAVRIGLIDAIGRPVRRAEPACTG